jgi:hypothetical protein
MGFGLISIAIGAVSALSGLGLVVLIDELSIRRW